MTTQRRATGIKVALAILVVGLAVPFLIRTIRTLATTRQAVAVYARLIASANAGDLATIRSLCSDRYRATHPIQATGQGGVGGFPRRIHPNYQVWIAGDEVWLCQGNRVGVVVRFIREAGRWRYDGEVGILRSDGQVTPASSLDGPASPGKNP